MIRSLPLPTHRSFVRTFRRLYLDRAGAAGVLLTAIASLSLGGDSAAAVGAALAATLYLGGSSLVEGTSRYAGRLEDRLRSAARSIRAISGAELVVLGHSHRRDAEQGYINPGAFGIADDRDATYVLAAVDGWADCRRVARADAYLSDGDGQPRELMA